MTRYPTGAPRRMALALAAAAVFGSVFAAAAPAPAAQPAATATAAGVLKIRSAYGFDETVTRLKADIAAKGIRFFDEIDQSKLAEGAGLPLGPSKLLLFGNPPLGVQFLTSNPYVGLDWPVRMLVVQDQAGQVWVAWTDFAWMADRYGVTDRDAAFKMASEVSASIAGSTQK